MQYVFGSILALLLGLFGLASLLVGLVALVTAFAGQTEDRAGNIIGGGVAVSVAVLFLLLAYTIVVGWSQPDTSQVRGPQPPGRGAGVQPKESDQASKPTPKPEEPKPKEPKPKEPKPEEPKPEEPKPEEPKPEEPITVERTTCLVKDAKTSEPRMTTAETAELLVTVSVPSNARECRDAVIVDAPTFGLGKEANQPVSIVRPKETYVARWLLDPEKPGSWNIAVETKRDRELVPVAVTTPLGFPATWVQAGAFIAGAATLLFGVFALINRRR